jgi:hypothetical protein
LARELQQKLDDDVNSSTPATTSASVSPYASSPSFRYGFFFFLYIYFFQFNKAKYSRYTAAPDEGDMDTQDDEQLARALQESERGSPFPPFCSFYLLSDQLLNNHHKHHQPNLSLMGFSPLWGT